MKFLKTFMLGIAALGLACSCSDDKNNGVTPEGSDAAAGEGVYMGLTIKMPSANGGRSATTEGGQSTDKVEVGTPSENNVSSVLLVIAKASDNSFIVAGELADQTLTALPSANSYKTITKINKSSISQYYTDNATAGALSDDDAKVNIFVFCNPTNDLKSIAKTATGDTEWFNKVGTVEVEGAASESPAENNIWASNGFLMCNYEIAEREIPRHLDDWNSYKTENTAFDFSGLNSGGQAHQVDNSANVSRGSVKVERVAARFDFKDGSDGNNTYNVVKVKDENSAEQTLVQIQLTKIALANMSKDYYYIPRVSDNGLNDNATLCGSEDNTSIRTNYVVGPNAADFNVVELTKPYKFNTYFNYPFFNNDGIEARSNWYTSYISDVLEKSSDNYGKKEYHVWRYATENVIPGDVRNQTLGKSTMVVFKGKMIPSAWSTSTTDKNNDTQLRDALLNATGDITKDPILYSFNGALYVTWENVRKAAIAASVEMDDNVPVVENGKLKSINRANPLYVAVFGNGGIGTFTWGESNTEYTDDLAADENCANEAWKTWANEGKPVDNMANMRSKITGAGFTIYQSSNEDETDGPGYYCYYFYKNRHNDNGDNGNMGIMEFAVVRNNVYKLAVTKISQLGHPRIPENDPDQPDPDEPDESDDIYLTVTCEVLSWVVRINNIEF